MWCSLHGVYDRSMFNWTKTNLSWKKETFDICHQTFVCNSYVCFFVDLCDLATTYYRVPRISLPSRTARSKFKLIKKIVHEDEDFLMRDYQYMLNYILSWLLKHVLINVFFSTVLNQFLGSSFYYCFCINPRIKLLRISHPFY